MKPFPVTKNEEERLSRIHSYGLNNMQKDAELCKSSAKSGH